MKSKSQKKRITISLDEYQQQLLAEAKKIALPPFCSVHAKKDDQRMIRLALWAFLRGVINAGKRVDSPMVADLRPESPMELSQRAAGLVATKLNSSAEPTLTDAELKYCKAEDIDPQEFLRVKTARG